MGCHQRALDLARATVGSWNEAHALAGLGRCTLAADHATQAETLLRQALAIFQRIGAAEADDISRELTGLTEAGPPRLPRAATPGRDLGARGRARELDTPRGPLCAPVVRRHGQMVHEGQSRSRVVVR
jgi:hypothetical protein